MWAGGVLEYMSDSFYVLEVLEYLVPREFSVD